MFFLSLFDSEKTDVAQYSVKNHHQRALEAANVTLRYFTGLCLPMGKMREIFDLHFCKTKSLSGKSLSCHKSRGDKQRAYLQQAV